MPIGSGAKGWPTGLFSHGMWLIWVLLPLVSACGRTVSPRKLSKWLPCNEVWLPTAAELSGGQTKRRMVAAALSSRSMQTSFFLCPSALLGPLLDTDRTLVKGHSYKILFDIFLTSSSLSQGEKSNIFFSSLTWTPPGTPGVSKDAPLSTKLGFESLVL